MNKSKLSSAVAIALGASIIAPNASAQLEEIVVTATKRAESAQDIPVAIQAIGAEALDELGVATFDQYVQYLPNVTAQGRGPGRSEIYIRGVASEQSNNTVSSVQGSAPTVALYLDEQPVAFGGRNIDIYAADLERVEVLPGPQGTLFGASSQAGTVRLITAKPSTEEFSGKVTAGYAFTTGGDPSTNLEATLNIPLSDTVAVRGTVYSDNQGGWIDNVPVAFNQDRATLVNVFNRNQAFSGVSEDATVVETTNSNNVQDNWNEARYTGFRLGLSWDINENWNLLLQHTDQDLSTEGSFEFSAVSGRTDASQNFSPEFNDDSFSLSTWTVNGSVGNLDIIYTGGFLQRDVNSLFDYTIYSFTGGYQNYYISTNNVAYGRDGSDTIFNQLKQFVDNTQNERQTHELRFQGTVADKFQWTVGGYFDDVETNSIGQFQYFGALDAGFIPGVRPSGLPDGINTLEPSASPTIFVNNFTREEDQVALFADFTFEVTDTVSISAGARYYDIDFDLSGGTGGSFGGCQAIGGTLDGLPVIGLNDVPNGPSAIQRQDGTFGCTGNSGNNVSARLTALGGGTLESLSEFGGFGGGVGPQGVLDAVAAGTLSIADIDNDGVSNQSDTIFRVTADWKATDDVLLFATFSEGFRPQTLNRNAASGASNQTGVFADFFVPALVETDELTNFEIGLKGDFFNQTLRLNATYFDSEIDNLQSSRFDPANIGILVFLENVGDAEVSGIDADFTWLATDQLTIQGAFSIIDSEIVALNDALVGVAAPVGSELPFTADFSFNLRGRYEFPLASFGADAFVQAGIVFTGDSASGITADANFIEDQTRRIFGVGSGLEIENLSGTFGSASQVSQLSGPVFGTTTNAAGETLFQAGRFVQESYELFNVSAGLSKDNWNAELYINNLFDEDGIVNINTFDGSPRVSVTRPRTVGVRFSYNFN